MQRDRFSRGVRRGHPRARPARAFQARDHAIYFNDDQPECIVHERYRDSGALTEHAVHLGDLAEAILAAGFVSGELLGEPSADLRAKMAGSVVRLFTPYLSM